MLLSIILTVRHHGHELSSINGLNLAKMMMEKTYQRPLSVKSTVQSGKSETNHTIRLMMRQIQSYTSLTKHLQVGKVMFYSAEGLENINITIWIR